MISSAFFSGGAAALFAWGAAALWACTAAAPDATESAIPPRNSPIFRMGPPRTKTIESSTSARRDWFEAAGRAYGAMVTCVPPKTSRAVPVIAGGVVGGEEEDGPGDVAGPELLGEGLLVQRGALVLLVLDGARG